MQFYVRCRMVHFATPFMDRVRGDSAQLDNTHRVLTAKVFSFSGIVSVSAVKLIQVKSVLFQFLESRKNGHQSRDPMKLEFIKDLPFRLAFKSE